MHAGHPREDVRSEFTDETLNIISLGIKKAGDFFALRFDEQIHILDSAQVALERDGEAFTLIPCTPWSTRRTHRFSNEVSIGLKWDALVAAEHHGTLAQLF